MNRAHPIWMVARREFRERGKSRIYAISTALLMLMVLAGIALPQLIGGDSAATTYSLGIVGEAPQSVIDALDAFAAANDARVEREVFAATDLAEAALVEGRIDAALVDGTEYVTLRPVGPTFFGSGDEELSDLVAAAVQTVRLQEWAKDAGVEEGGLAALLSGEPISLRSLESDDPDSEKDAAIAFFGLMLLVVGIFTYGAWTLNGIIEEKSNRVVEVLISAVRPHQLMAGKVIGLGLMALLQLVLILATAAIAAVAVGLLEVPEVPAGLLVSLVLWFILGFSFYSVGYAAVGALVSRTEEAQSVATPLSLAGAASYLAAFIALEFPEGALARITTLLPPVAPFVVPVRHAQHAISWWEYGLAVVIMVAATYGLIRFAGRVYTGAVLRAGARVKLRDAWRSADR